MKTNPSKFRGDQLPVENVSWPDAVNYCKTIGGRLPWETEWEYAARAGSTSIIYGELGATAWYSQNSKGRTHDVGAKQPNQFGLYDMLGNVWEWVEDDFGPYKPESEKDRPVQVSGAASKVVRGGSWWVGPQFIRASNRLPVEPNHRDNNIGFRCVENSSRSLSSSKF